MGRIWIFWGAKWKTMSIIISNWKVGTPSWGHKSHSWRIRSRHWASKPNKQEKLLSSRSEKPNSKLPANSASSSDKSPTCSCKSSNWRKAVVHHPATPHIPPVNSKCNTKGSKKNSRSFSPRWAPTTLNRMKWIKGSSTLKGNSKISNTRWRICIITWMPPIWHWTRCNRQPTPQPPIQITTKNPSPST